MDDEDVAELTKRFVPRLGPLQPAAVAARLRRSLFVVPGACVVGGALLAELVLRADREGYGDWLPLAYDTSLPTARALLAAIATGSITVVTLVLTFTLVAVQLAAGQLSPRTITNYLEDRFQQATIGLVLGTTTYSLAALRAVDRVFTSETPSPNITMLTALVLTVVSLLFLVGSVDRIGGRLQVGRLIDDVAADTCDLVRRLHGDQAALAAADEPGEVISAPLSQPSGPSWTASATVSADTSGWVQIVDEEALLDALPDGGRVRLVHPVGTFVYADMALVELDRPEIDDETAASLRKAIVLGDARTMQQDVGFGITRLVDIGLRALSPGINDANTAREVVLRLGQIVLTLQQFELPPRVTSVDGHQIERRGEPSHDDYVHAAFEQMRLAAADQAAVLETLDRTLTVIEDETERRGLPGGVEGVRTQRRLVTEMLDAFELSRVADERDVLP